MTRRLLPYGERGLLVECVDLTEVLGLLRSLQQSPPGELAEIVPGARTLFLRTRERPSDSLREALLELQP
ncbi:MAG TPA: allophanate hydrolase, partial [Microlunatus sp.]|nr:allophanate hydrolase [Microlunatus sp.]